MTIPHRLGLLGHSDADVVLHAVIDAILGALGQGDIGQHFPDTDNEFKDIDSRNLLRKVTQMMSDSSHELSNLDVTIVAQEPKLAPHKDAIKSNIASDLNAKESLINIKATTTEGLGFVW